VETAGQRGHWHKECPNPYKPKAKSKPGFFVSASGRGSNRFVFALKTIDQLIAEVRDNPRGMSFFCIQSGMAVVDAAAGRPLMGHESMSELREGLNEKGFDFVYVEKSDLPTARGVGGSSRPLGVAFVPVSIGGIEGIVEFVVIQEKIAPLLPIGLLKGFKAAIDLGEEKMSVVKDEQRGTAALVELPTGHQAVSIIADDPDEFSFPEGFLESFQYSPSDFQFCRYNDRDISWHDAIDAMVSRCHVGYGKDFADGSIVPNVSCLFDSKAEHSDNDDDISSEAEREAIRSSRSD